MRFQRVHLRDTIDGSRGFEFATSERDARMIVARFKETLKAEAKANGIPAVRAAKFCGDIDPVDIEPTRPGILKALNKLAGHPDNG